jgi:hypothetical protein
MRDGEGDDACLLPTSDMMRSSVLPAMPPVSAIPAITAPSLIKIKHVKKNSGSTDRDYADGLRAGDVFEVNHKETNFPRGKICKSRSTNAKVSLFSN